MFIGSFIYAIDNKSRLSIPAKFRKNLKPEAKDTFVMTRGVAKCIDLYPLDYWNEVIQKKLDKLDPFDPKEAMFMRMFLQIATEDTLDSQSRILIPEQLSKYAGIQKEAFILGAIRKIEIWNPKEYEQYIASQNKSFEEIAKEVMTGK